METLLTFYCYSFNVSGGVVFVFIFAFPALETVPDNKLLKLRVKFN